MPVRGNAIKRAAGLVEGISTVEELNHGKVGVYEQQAKSRERLLLQLKRDKNPITN
jgi:hypothetical protein